MQEGVTPAGTFTHFHYWLEATCTCLSRICTARRLDCIFADYGTNSTSMVLIVIVTPQQFCRDSLITPYCLIAFNDLVVQRCRPFHVDLFCAIRQSVTFKGTFVCYKSRASHSVLHSLPRSPTTGPFASTNFLLLGYVLCHRLQKPASTEESSLLVGTEACLVVAGLGSVSTNANQNNLL